MTTTEAATEVAQVEAPGWRFFDTVVIESRRLGPSTVRLTLGAPELTGFGAAGDDQRIKFVLPRPGTDVDIGGLMAGGADWYAAYCALADEVRPLLRTYTVRAARPEHAEIDVDVVLHGVADGSAGPAATWAAAAVPGDRLVVLGPDRPGSGRMWGVEWAPPATAHTLLLVGDETAVPAVGAILTGLASEAAAEDAAPGRRVVALLEVPEVGDAQVLDVPAGVTVRWLPRSGRVRGELLVPAVHAALCELGIASPGRSGEVLDGEVLDGEVLDGEVLDGEVLDGEVLDGEVLDGEVPKDTDLDTDPDGELLWEVPDVDATAGCYAWLAGEAGVVKRLRRHLVTDLGVPRNEVAFMGYWRVGACA